MKNEDIVLKRIDELLVARGWTFYRLSELSGVTQSTLTNSRRRNTTPGVNTIIALCNAFELTLSQFFTTEDELTTILSKEESKLINDLRLLGSIDRKIVMNLIEGLKSRNQTE